MKHEHDEVRSRNESFSDRVVTRIWDEEPCPDNPYLANTNRCHGYDLVELMEKRSFVDVFYLLFRGELPTPEESKILETLMIGLINPGPRHSATRAAMNAGIGKTDTLHILPISMMVLGGAFADAGVIEEGIRFLRKQRRNDPSEVAGRLLKESEPPTEGDRILAPGFGSLYGSVDPYSKNLVNTILELPGAGPVVCWGASFANEIQSNNLGWLRAGVAAAVFADLGFQPRAGGGLFQLLNAPGLLAHGLELANKPITAMPFIADDHYVIES
ncbi:citrate/2-methylcitrate synthase [Motiliproteus sp. MSK22-1]|uniref:citrate/2-methylcitrate synthase n=1 Tax=Motiliproteus sp. MSK22-1 TaxID=1897630 RepID=UPI0009779ABF|nr:citrate/2-methylcitrate synthase [Motiliproteus sp. MSK22-1]OMH38256.1 citrate synthase [Motiliproteus sp. MSK22-1]